MRIGLQVWVPQPQASKHGRYISSSVSPSQSSSIPLQASFSGGVSVTQTSSPSSVQVKYPGLHEPSSLPQGPKFSSVSIIPSQSLSAPSESQNSCSGPT